MIPWRCATNSASAVLLCVAMLFEGGAAQAQLYEKTIIHTGDSVSKYYSYLFPSFKTAVVKMRDGRSSVYPINFNMLLCDMQFINRKQDTLEITNPEEIDSIVLDSCSFIYDYKQGYLQILVTSNAASLAVLRQSTFDPIEMGAMGTPRHSGGIEMWNSISSRQGTLPLQVNSEIYAYRNTRFLLIYKSGETENAGKSAFIRIYDGDKRSFDQFVKNNRIDFNKPGDLVELFDFCMQSKK